VIPRIIWTIWLNDNPEIPELAQECIATQKLQGYEHRFITLENCYNGHQYIQDALRVKKWVKACDFLRMHYLYTEGGIYLDADTKVLKPFDDMLHNRLFCGVEANGYYATGVVGAEPFHPLVGLYLHRIGTNFKGDGDMIFEPGIRAWSDLIFIADRQELGLKVYDRDYFYPYYHGDGTTVMTENTHTYHFYMKSWVK
jgi:hypothetical protein